MISSKSMRSIWGMLAGAAVGVLLSTFVEASAEDKLPEHAWLRLGTSKFAPGSFLLDLAILPGQSQIVTIGADQKAQLWSKDWKLLRTTPRNRRLVHSSYSLDCRWRVGVEQIEGPEESLLWSIVATNLVTGREVSLAPPVA